jgi:hypothetical protein
VYSYDITTHATDIMQHLGIRWQQLQEIHLRADEELEETSSTPNNPGNDSGVDEGRGGETNASLEHIHN